MGILDGGNINPAMFWQMMNAQQHDPFSRPLMGDKVLPQSMNQQNLPPTLSPTGNPQQPPPNPQTFDNVSTDFVGTEQGLPNLPDTFTGFGFGQTAPKKFEPMGLKQQLIQHMMSQLPSFQGQGMQMQGMGQQQQMMSPHMQGFGGAQGFGGGMNGFAG